MEQMKPRRPKKIFDRRSVFFSVTTLILFAVAIGMLYSIKQSSTGSTDKTAQDAQVYRELGNKLKSEKMYDQAIEAYNQYLARTPADDQTRSNIYYLIGDLHFEKHRYEQALAAYYMADILGAGDLIRNDLNIKIVNCLERLGRDFSAEYALQSKTAVDQSEQQKQPQGQVVATYGDQVVTMRDLDEKLELLPEEQRRQYRDPQKKFMFLQQYLATELLARKAKKMGYDRDADVLEQLEDLKKQLMVQKMVQAQFNDKVDVTPEDLQLYYDANKQKYTEPAAVRIAHIVVETEDTAQEALAKINEGTEFAQVAADFSADADTASKGGVIDQWLTLENAGADNRAQLVNAALELNEGEVSQPIQDEQGYHIVKLLAKKPPKQLPFAEVAQQVAQDYQMFKAQNMYRDMMENILKVEGVQIQYDAFFKQPDDAKKQQEPAVDIKPITPFNQ